MTLSQNRISIHLQVLTSGPMVLILDLLFQESESWFSILSLCALLCLGRSSPKFCLSGTQIQHWPSFSALSRLSLPSRAMGMSGICQGFSTIFLEPLQSLPLTLFISGARTFCLFIFLRLSKSPLFLWRHMSFQPGLPSTKICFVSHRYLVSVYMTNTVLETKQINTVSV